MDMRAVLIALGGLAASFGAFGISRMLDGLPGAVFFMLSFFIAPIAIAVAATTAVRHDPDRPRAPARSLTRPSLRRGRGRPLGKASQCKECGGSRELRGQIWVCTRCDLGAAVPDNL